MSIITNLPTVDDVLLASQNSIDQQNLQIDQLIDPSYIEEEDSPEAIDINQQLIIDRKNQYRQNKRYVKSYLGQKIAFGSNSLLIKKMTGKFISMIEIQNGLIHEHRRHDMAGTVKYLNYKKSILSRPHSSTEKQIDIKNQSSGYIQQMNNILEFEDEIKYLINLMYEESKCSLTYNIEFSNDVVQLNLEDGSIINIYFRYDDKEEKLALSHNININNIVCSQSLHLITFLQKLSTLVLSNDNKAALEFRTYMSSMYWGRLQLDKLVTVDDSFDVDVNLKADIVTFIEKASVGNKLEHLIGEHIFDNRSYSRFFILKKLTKVRTVIELIAKNDGEEIVEYRSTISKISHNILDNTSKILNIHNALK